MPVVFVIEYTLFFVSSDVHNMTSEAMETFAKRFNKEERKWHHWCDAATLKR